MSLPVRRAAPSHQDEAEILDYFGQVNVDAGLRFIDSLQKTLDKIGEFPDLGSPHERETQRLKNLRYWPVQGFENYLVFYQRLRDSVLVLRILHGRRDLDSIL